MFAVVNASRSIPMNFVRGGGGVQQIQLGTEDREGGLGAIVPYPLVKGSGCSCNLVEEISFHIIKVSITFWRWNYFFF